MSQITPAVNQAAIDLYDEYTHAPLPRRDFITRLAMLLGSSAAAYAFLPVLENNYAQAALVDEKDTRISASHIEFQGSTGLLKAYLAKPIRYKKQLGSVLVIHENRGLNAHIQDVARRVALAGYNALALDFLSPLGGTPTNEDEARAQFSKLDAVQSVANGRAALAYLDALPNSNGKLGCVGFCWGGAMANQLAVYSPELSAAVCYYGMAPNLLLVKQIKSQVLLHYAGEDERINATRVAYEAALNANNIRFESYIYEGKQHAFHNDSNTARYNQQAAELSWKRTLAMFNKAL